MYLLIFAMNFCYCFIVGNKTYYDYIGSDNDLVPSAIQQEAYTEIYQDLWHHMKSLGHNDLRGQNLPTLLNLYNHTW